ncbi:cytochrome P450 [Archangium sp.]|uniref:cytochrome P450 n=1 Tax=Archangium sp. TaxID=1872627 RepID=UPI002D343398|nr:cytochrome P450 [Archangium sp.]HYO58795.1 cytochrome P450 [Archangium sp.]
MIDLPPGPGSPLVATLKYLRDPYGSLRETARRYGEPHTSPSFLGKMVVTGDPAGIRTLFTADPDTYSALGAELLGPILGESNLILLSGERHRAMRKLQMPPFHGTRMRAYGQLIIDAAEEHAARWPRDRPIQVHRTMQQISLQVILEAVLGLREPGKRESFQAAVLAVIAALKPSFMFIEALRRPLLGLSAWAHFQRTRVHVAALFEEELRARRTSSEPREDILSLLLSARYDDGTALTDDELLTQMMNLIVAGHETTASSLAWAFHHIHHEPAVKTRLVEELRGLPEPLDPEAISRLPYLEAVCSETLRLTPVAPLIGRKLRKGLTLQGFDLPPGVAVGIGILLVHRRADLYPEPERFRPERFLERSYTPFEYLPFGGGARRCIGAAFALYEMKLVLATILRRYDLRPASNAPVHAAVRNTTVGPRREIELLHA